jgi:hypothetical protein
MGAAKARSVSATCFFSSALLGGAAPAPPTPALLGLQFIDIYQPLDFRQCDGVAHG